MSDSQNKMCRGSGKTREQWTFTKTNHMNKEHIWERYDELHVKCHEIMVKSITQAYTY